MKCTYIQKNHLDVCHYSFEDVVNSSRTGESHACNCKADYEITVRCKVQLSATLKALQRNACTCSWLLCPPSLCIFTYRATNHQHKMTRQTKAVRH